MGSCYGRQGRRFAPYRFACQPCKCAGFHLQGRQATGLRRAHLQSRQPRLKSCHQVAIKGPAPANNQYFAIKSVANYAFCAATGRQLRQCGLHIGRLQVGEGFEFFSQPRRAEQVAPRCFWGRLAQSRALAAVLAASLEGPGRWPPRRRRSQTPGPVCTGTSASMRRCRGRSQIPERLPVGPSTLRLEMPPILSTGTVSPARPNTPW
jgi:hypothetical protein